MAPLKRPGPDHRSIQRDIANALDAKAEREAAHRYRERALTDLHNTIIAPEGDEQK